MKKEEKMKKKKKKKKKKEINERIQKRVGDEDSNGHEKSFLSTLWGYDLTLSGRG